MRKRLFLAASFLWICALSDAAQSEARRPELNVSHAVKTPGVLAVADDPAWQGAEKCEELHLITKDPASRAGKFSTRVELQWDAQFLYVRFWCRAPETPWAPHGDKHDARHHEGDVVEVFIDPVGDVRQFVELQVSPANGVLDKLYLLTAQPETSANGLLRDDLLRRDQWEFLDWNYDGLRSATSEWRQNGTTVGWIVDLALPSAPLLRRLDLKTFQAGLTLRAHLLRNACPVDTTSATGRTFLSFSWTPVPIGRPHRSPSTMGELHLMP